MSDIIQVFAMPLGAIFLGYALAGPLGGLGVALVILAMVME